MRRRFFFFVVMALLWVLLAQVAFAQEQAPEAAFAQSAHSDKVVLNQTYTLAEGEVLTGNLAAINAVVVLAPGSIVYGDVAAFGSNLEVRGTIVGSVAVFGSRVTLGDSAAVTGDLAALGGSVEQVSGATIRGETFMGQLPFTLEELQIPAPALDLQPPVRQAAGFLERFLGWQLRTLGVTLLLALLGVFVMLIAPRGVAHIANAAATQTAVSFGVGLLTLMLAIFAGALLLIACGLGLLIWLALIVGLILGWIGIGLWVGQRLLAALRVRPASSVAELVLGIFLITVLAGLPLCIGFLIWLVLASIGLGAVVMTRFGAQAAGYAGSHEVSRDAAATPEPLLLSPDEPEVDTSPNSP